MNYQDNMNNVRNDDYNIPHMNELKSISMVDNNMFEKTMELQGNSGSVQNTANNGINNMNNINNVNNINENGNTNYMNTLNYMNGVNKMNNMNYDPDKTNDFSGMMRNINNSQLENESKYSKDNESLLNKITNEIVNKLGPKKYLGKIEDTENNINEGVKNIEDAVNTIKKLKNKENKNISKFTNINKENSSNNKKDESFIEKIINYYDAMDFLIIFVIFFMLSQEMIKDFISSYISWINPDNEGKVGVGGVLAYGVILGLMFIVTRKIMSII